MAGNYPDDLSIQTEAFVQSALQWNKGLEPAAIHLDAILEHKVSKQQYLPLASIALQELISKTSGMEDLFMPSLRIPLNDADYLNTNSPKLDDLLDDLTLETPILYLFRREILKYLWPVEIYIFPLHDNLLFSKQIDGVYVYYRSFRTFDDVRNDREYTRDICADYYPSKYNPTNVRL